MSVTAVSPAGTGYLRIRPADTGPVNATFLNFGSSSITNAGTVTLSADGRVTVGVFGSSSHVVVDVLGYYHRDDAAGRPPSVSLYVPATPCRVVDTRVAGGQVPANGQRTWQVTGTTGFAPQGGTACGVPTGATAVEATVTAVGPSTTGFLRIWPAGGPVPTATILNY